MLLLAAADDGGELAPVLRAAADLDLPQDAVDAAERAGLVETDDLTLTFRHPLVRSAVYKSATSGERRRAHAALADAYRDDHHGDRQLWHRAVATLTADEQLAAALEASAERSQLRGGHASAATAFERAAELSEGESARGKRLALAAQAAWVAGQAERARGVIDRSLPLVGRTQRVRLLYLSGVIEGRSGLLESGIAKVQQAAALSDDPSLCLEMIREASVMALSADDYEQMIALGRSAEGLPRATRRGPLFRSRGDRLRGRPVGGPCSRRGTGG